MTTIRGIVCPTCKQGLVIEITEDTLEPFKFAMPLELDDSHKIILLTTHHNEISQDVSRLMSVILMHCPGESTKNTGEESTQPDPWHRLCQFWKTALDKLDDIPGGK